MGLHCLTKYLFKDYQSTSEQHLNCMQYNTTFKVRLYTFRVCTLEKYRLHMVQTKYGSTGPEVIKLFSCSTQLSTQLSTKFQLLIKTKIPTNKNFYCFKSLRCCIYNANKC